MAFTPIELQDAVLGEVKGWKRRCSIEGCAEKVVSHTFCGFGIEGVYLCLMHYEETKATLKRKLGLGLT